ncbi:germin-like protein subfamily 3 member 3 [Dioscorea cayenensis subsp. rotundata]|uniref:Germin-like protein n=1 Tax=Dioscorea cayennensis subsp. rotundata TaxID=55577 RepID=A0AB40D0I9_DIOCR|nr:germin-like protein subfamily 3 member 3 [Dioscorea cayenensis subsp. rotundata]
MPQLFILFFFFFFFILFISFSKADPLQDFCVADLTLPQSPAGYSCKNVSQVTVDDFVFTGFRNPRNNSNTNMASLTPAFVAQWPALNGLGIAAVYAELAPGGQVPIHSHPGGTELIVVIEGTVIAGFISSSNKAYTKKVDTFEAMIFPQGLLHFQVNTGSVKAKYVVSFSSSNPGVQTTSMSLFGNDLPSEILEKVSSIDVVEVKKLKAMFGGTN